VKTIFGLKLVGKEPLNPLSEKNQKIIQIPEKPKKNPYQSTFFSLKPYVPFRSQYPTENKTLRRRSASEKHRWLRLRHSKQLKSLPSFIR
jgi:hypothetical protein